MATIIEQLSSGATVITDGAWGTQLQSLGLPSGCCPDAWNLDHADLVEQVPRAYVAAGSQVVLTNTFRANRIALADYGLADSVESINAAGVAISRRAAGDKACVFASIGPSGKLLFAGQVEARQLSSAFHEQAAALAAAGADALVIETMADLEEARLALEAARAAGLPVVACMTFDAGRDKDRTMTGCTPEQVARELTTAGADAIGANCGQGPEGYAAICRCLRAATDRPIWIKANAGAPRIEGDQVAYDAGPDEFARGVDALIDAGASFIGGCCGTSPATIAAINRRLGR